ncbi:MAG: hypothetical protein AAGA12_03620 [Pseudomonadota bacterium]
MKAMLTAFAATILIAIAADQVLSQAGFSAQEQTAGDAVRLD